MTNYQRELDAYAAETETSPTDMAIARMRWEANKPSSRSAIPWLTPARMVFAGGLVAAAAAVLIALNPSAPANLIDPAGPMVLGESAPVDVALPEGISIAGEGEAVLSGTEGDRVVDLDSGRMTFEVTPNAGLHLTVNTGEGTTTVLGTVFDVDRTAMGTTVSVERGKVQVDCAGQEPVYVLGGDAPHTCLSAVGYLDRGVELRDGGAAPEAVLDGIAGADALLGEADLSVQADLEVLRIDTLARLSQHDQVLSGVEAFLGNDALVGAASEQETAGLRRNAMAAAYKSGGCEAAMPWLEVIYQGGEAGIAELKSYAGCLNIVDGPGAGRAVLEEALSGDLSPEDEAALRKLLGQ